MYGGKIRLHEVSEQIFTDLKSVQHCLALLLEERNIIFALLS